MSVRIMLVDDHPAILLGLSCILDAEPDLEVVATEQSSREAPATYHRTGPDVVVLDLSMPGNDGLAVMRRIRTESPDATILVLTSCSDPETVTRVLAAGANGYMRKDCAAGELVHAVRSVALGDVPIDPRVTRALLQAPPRVTDAVQLTDRELDVLRLVAQGLANKQIAGRLGIGASTVKTHLSNAFQRIGVSDRTSAALWVRAHDAHEALADTRG